MEPKIHIIGSCANRDTFRILDRDRLIGRYTSRSSLISRMSPPINFDICSYFDSSLDWKQKMIVEDFNKNGLYINDYARGILLIDFLDERFQLLEIENTFVTESTEFERMKLGKVLPINKVLSRGGQTDFNLWTDACHKFTNLIPQSIRNKTVLHKAFWANNYLKDGNLCSFKEQSGIEFYNRNLSFYYETFESIYSPGYVIELPLEKRIADPYHEWGLAPFHYIFEYYQAFYQQLKLTKFTDLPI